MELPPHDVWLQDLDLLQEGVVAALIDTAAFGQEDVEEDLASTRELLIKYAGRGNHSQSIGRAVGSEGFCVFRQR